MSLRIFDPSSGGETRSWRASAWSASSRYFVCSAYCTVGRRSRKSADGAVVRAAADRGTPAHRQGRRATPWQSGQRTRASSDWEIMQRTATTSLNSVLEPLGAPLPGIVNRTPPPRRAPAARASAGSSSSRRNRRGDRRGIARLRPAAHSPRRAGPRESTAGRDATIARPAAMYSNSFSGDVNRSEIADAGFGSTRIVALRSSSATRPGSTSPVNVTRSAIPSRSRSALTRARSGSAACPPTMSPRTFGTRRERFEQHVDTFPRIQMPGIGDHRRTA